MLKLMSWEVGLCYFSLVRQSCKNECNEHMLHGDCLCPAACTPGPHPAGDQTRGSEGSGVLLQRAEPCRASPLKMGSCTPPQVSVPAMLNRPCQLQAFGKHRALQGQRVAAIEVKTLTLFTSNCQCLVLHKTIWNGIKYLQWLPRKQTLPVLQSTSSGTDYF